MKSMEIFFLSLHVYVLFVVSPKKAYYGYILKQDWVPVLFSSFKQIFLSSLEVLVLIKRNKMAADEKQYENN